MAQLKTVMDILKLLDKSNCRDCASPTCMAFAASVFKGEKQLADCTHLDKEIIEQYAGNVETPGSLDQQADEFIEQLKKEVAKIDLAEAARRIQATYTNDKLTFKILGKDFSVNTAGDIITDIHVHGWVAGPALNYILNGKHVQPTGKWVPLRELPGGKDWGPLFSQRCEKPLKSVADNYTDLFEDMIHLFSGSEVEKHYQSDISLVLHPLPSLPIMICYWKPDDGLDSNLNLFFDANAEENVDVDSIYTLGTGLVIMFEKISQRHG